MTPRMSLRPTTPTSVRSLPITVDDRAERAERALWKRNETSLAVSAIAGVVEAIVASWIVAVAMRDLLATIRVDSGASFAVVVTLARVGLVVAEALGALAISVAAGALLLRMEHRASVRETVPFWTRVVAVVRIVGGAIVFGAGWKLGWSFLLESRAPWLLPLLAAAQLATLVVASFRPISTAPRGSPSTPARASGKQSA